MDLKLEGKVFLITGGSSGLGRALAERPLAEGAHGVALMARGSERLASTAVALREDGGDVRVNAVVIGVIESGQLERYAADAGITPEAYYERMVADSRIPLGRVGRAHEFGDVGSFLLSPRVSYVTGTAINLDGGLCPVV